jgi:hypothetical protein
MRAERYRDKPLLSLDAEVGTGEALCDRLVVPDGGSELEAVRAIYWHLRLALQMPAEKAHQRATMLTAVVLLHECGFTLDEQAAQLGVSTRSLKRARHQLRELLDAEELRDTGPQRPIPSAA